MDAPHDLNGPGSEWAKRLFLCMAGLPAIYAQIQWHRVKAPDARYGPLQTMYVNHFEGSASARYEPSGVGMFPSIDQEQVELTANVFRNNGVGDQGRKTLFYYFGVTQDGKHAYFTPDPLIEEMS